MEVAVVLLGVVFVVAAVYAWPTFMHQSGRILTWAAMVVVANLCTFTVARHSRWESDVSLNGPVLVGIALQFDWAVAYALVGLAAVHWRECTRRAPWRLALFNRGQQATSTAVAALVVGVLRFAEPFDHPLWAVFVAVAVFVLLNSLLSGAMPALRGRGSARVTVPEALGPTWQAGVCYFGFVLIGASVLVLGVTDVLSFVEAAPLIVGGVLALVGLLVAVQAREAQMQLRAALAHSVRAAEDERRVVGRYLHDEAVQSLSAAAVLLGSCRRQMGADAPVELVDAEAAVREATSSARGLLERVVPPSLDGGLGVAVSRELEMLQLEGYGTRLCDAVGGALDRSQAEVAFAVVQEGLRNVRRHAGAGAVEVRIGQTGEAIEVAVVDDGRGAPGDSSGRSPTGGHFGLTLLRELARRVNGTVTLRNRPDAGGAELLLRIPQ